MQSSGVSSSQDAMRAVRWAFNFTKWDPTRADISLASSCIQVEEKERLARFAYKNDVKASLVGRLMMRKFVSEASGRPYDQIKFSRSPEGKPLVEASGGVFWNVSHQGDYTVLGGGGGLLGVDVVKVERPRGKTVGEYLRIMGRVFTESEWETIKGAPSEGAQLAMFYRHWCLKESYLKAVGLGVAANLQEVCFKVNSKELGVERVVNDTEGWHRGVKLDGWEFQEMMLDECHYVAVALNCTKNEKVLFKEISFEEVVNGAVPILPQDEHFCNEFFRKMDK